MKPKKSKDQGLGSPYEQEPLTGLDDQDKLPRAGFTRRLPNGKTVKVKPTKVKRRG